VAGWTAETAGRFSLLDVVRNATPTVLVGVSGQAGAFTEEIVRTLHAGCARPIVLPLSNPTNRVEATPANLLRWTSGGALVGSGSPFAPVTLDGVTHHIGQCNNVFVFPGIGLGASVLKARWLPDEVFAAAARAVYECTGLTGEPGAPIFPTLDRLREVSYRVAIAVGRALVTDGAAAYRSDREIEDLVAASVWEPVYQDYRPA
jgi:malate dehydrogenase (oxaloacetate-decarboxylating)